MKLKHMIGPVMLAAGIYSLGGLTAFWCLVTVTGFALVAFQLIEWLERSGL